VAWLTGQPLPTGRFQLEPWPAVSPLEHFVDPTEPEVLLAA